MHRVLWTHKNIQRLGLIVFADGLDRPIGQHPRIVPPEGVGSGKSKGIARTVDKIVPLLDAIAAVLGPTDSVVPVIFGVARAAKKRVKAPFRRQISPREPAKVPLRVQHGKLA